jgi:hypothetical protein
MAASKHRPRHVVLRLPSRFSETAPTTGQTGQFATSCNVLSGARLFRMLLTQWLMLLIG